MDIAGFCRQANLLVVAGKGGVGKTTVTAALALAGAQAGLDVVLTSLGDSGSLPRLFGADKALSFEESVLSKTSGGGVVRGRLLTADAALVEYLGEHGLGRVSRRLVKSGALDIVATAIPGIREVLVLGKLKQLERAGSADLLLLDAPATGHALRFLTSSGGLLDAARGGPLREQAEQVVEMLSDPLRCQVVLVTIPEETPVNETIETAFRLEDEVGISLGPVIVNDCYPTLQYLEDDPREAARAAGALVDDDVLRRVGTAAAFRSARQRLQNTQLERLDRGLPLPRLTLPHIFTSALGPNELEALAESLTEGIEALA
jgi:anion-transporting  ArsA/GET3 family ATPase